jgi:hypothetical protein
MSFLLILDLVLLVASTVLTAVLAKMNEQKPSALGTFTEPTAEEGRSIPVVFGTVQMRGPNVTWYGDLWAQKVKANTPWWMGGFILNLFAAIIGYKYHLGLHMVLCQGPVDALVPQGSVINQSGIHVGDGQIVGISLPPGAHQQTWTLTAISATEFTAVGSVDGSGSHAFVGVPYYHSNVTFLITEGPTTPFQIGDQFIFDTVVASAIFADSKAVTYTSNVVLNGPDENYIALNLNSPKLFGGDHSVGGIQGFVAFYRGLQTSLPDPYLSSKLPGLNGGPAPSYLGLCHCVFYQVYVGTQTSMFDMSWIVQRCPDPLAQSNSNINGDANPAWMIYEWMTNQVWGSGIPTSMFDNSSFIAAAATLFTERLGMSSIVDTQASGDSVIADILRHIDAVLYTDPASGLWTLKLVRLDYDPATLPVLDNTNILEPPEMSRISWEETINSVKVSYVDRGQFFTMRVVQEHEPANHAVRGQIGTLAFDYKCLSNSSVAQTVAARELKAHSYPLMQIKLYANRFAWNFRMGGVFKLTYGQVVGMACRITQINYGALEAGRIEITAIEDIFAIPFTGYNPPPFPGWTDPTRPPAPPLAEALMEFPYFMTMPGTPRFVMAMAARADAITNWYDIEESGVDVKDQQPFTSYGVLLSAFNEDGPMDDATGFVMAASPQADCRDLVAIDAAQRYQGLNLFVIDKEIMAFSTPTINTDGTVNIAGVLRGLFDTVPADHAPGAGVWFFGDNAGVVNSTAYATDVSLSVKCLPVNNYGEVLATAVTAVLITTESRAQLPYPPGNALVNGISYPDFLLGDTVMTWTDRNRVAQGVTPLIQSAASVPGGIEGNYTIEVLIDGIVVHTHTGVTGNTFTYTLADRLTDNPDGGLITGLRITPVNGTLIGHPRTVSFLMSGFGVMFGMEFGGLQQ